MKTNVADTSIETYYEHLLPSGKLATQQSRGAAWFLSQTEPRTIREMGESLGWEMGTASRVCNSLSTARVILQTGTKQNIHGCPVKAFMHAAVLPKIQHGAA
jgi:hypothetical protein